MVRSPRRVEPLPPEPDRVRRSGSEEFGGLRLVPSLVGGSGDQPGPADAVFADLKAELDRVPSRLEDRDLEGIDNAERNTLLRVRGCSWSSSVVAPGETLAITRKRKPWSGTSWPPCRI